ncbi:phosphotransferase family protein [Rubrobacter aplysinae]|uniref:phosphotransferase family protein n=1 Tax=Rubrobacter aplysinae TaxID=909625 RepID=UPI00069DB878|nr:aminoglycoside phosphotransferase family protein [Rubrobacter aplysinae]
MSVPANTGSVGEGPEAREILAYLRGLPPGGTPWDAPPSGADVSFLARGEYSLNYLVGLGRREEGDGVGRRYVVRLITGSQMGLGLGEQALYEHHALSLVSASGVTPAPRLVDPEPGGLPYPVIVEDYLPGRPLDYATDLRAAARCIAAIHALGVPEDHGLQVHPDPAPAVLEESAGLVEPYLEWSGASEESQRALGAAFGRIREFQKVEGLFETGDLAVVNYDLNTHNFVVADGEARLLDWEKARVAPRTEDVAHFLIPTTTLWRDETATRLTPAQEREFLDKYEERAGVGDVERFETQLTAVRLMISLRAVSWCAWALQAHKRGHRPAGDEMLDKARRYLDPAFLEDLFRLRETSEGG